MKQFILLLLVLGTSTLFAQGFETDIAKEKRTAVTIGLLNGGGSLVGADVEFLVSDRVGFQLGAGIVGYGAGINYHFRPSIRSSFLSFQYWNQGVNQTFTQNIVGPSFVYRAKKWFTAQIGLGMPLQKGPAFPNDREQTPVLLLYSIGAYVPI